MATVPNMQHTCHRWYEQPLDMARSRLGRGHVAQLQIGQKAEKQIGQEKGIGVALVESVGLACGMPAEKIGPCLSTRSLGKAGWRFDWHT